MNIHISTFPIISLDSPRRLLSAASNKQILARKLLNPKRIYQQQGKIDKVISVMNKLLLGMPDMMNEYRERGLLLNFLGAITPRSMTFNVI